MPENLGNFRIDGDVEILLLGDLLVPRLDLGFDPVVELLADDGAGHVHDELFWQPSQFFRCRIVIVAFWLLIEKCGDLLDAEAFILRHEDVFQILAFDN